MLALGILALSILVALWPALAPGNVLLPAGLPYALDPLWRGLATADQPIRANPVLVDQLYQFHVWNLLARALLAQGELPLWNPYINGGQPLLGNGLAGIFSPFHVVGYAAPLAASYGIGAALRLLVAGSFTYLYARAIGLRWAGAVLSMLVFAHSGPMMVWLGYPPSHVIAWLPALLWATERLLSTRRGDWAALCGLLIGLLALGGQPEIAFLAAATWALYAVARSAWLAGGLWAGLRRYGGWLALAAGMGLALAAVETLSFLEALPHSAILASRTNTQVEASLARSLLFDWHAWPTLVTALMPHFFGSEADESYWYPYSNTVEQNAYAGVLPLALAATALFYVLRRRDEPQRGWVLLWATAAMASLALALRLPVVNGANLLPPMSLVESGRLRLVYALAAALLAGLGLDLLLRHGEEVRRPLLRLLVVAAAANVLAGAVAYAGFVLFQERLIASGRAFMEANVGAPYLAQPLAVLYDLVEQRYEAKLTLLRPTNLVMYLPVLMLLVYLALAWMRRRWNLGLRFEASALIVLTAVDLLWASYGFNEAAPARWLEVAPEAIAFLQQEDEPFRLNATGLILNPNAAMLYGLSDARGYDAMAVERTMAVVRRLEGHYPAHYHSLFVRSEDRLLDLLNVRYVLTDQALASDRWQEAFADPSGVAVYRNRTALPRAWMAYEVEVVATPEESLARLLDPAFDFRRQVVLEEAIETNEDWQAGPATVEFLNYEANLVRLHVSTQHPGLLVLADTWMPGWKATVDGAPRPIHVADHAFRAVIMPEGEHTVEFVYAPTGVRIGLWISGATLAIYLLLLGRRAIRGLMTK
jgi:hypothetical protein